MKKSSVIYNFAISRQQGKILLTAQEYPFSVLQVITFEPKYFDKVVDLCKRRGLVAVHDTDRSFCIIHLCSGDQNGKYPDKHINTDTPEDVSKYLEALKDAMAQAVVWYFTNIIERVKIRNRMKKEYAYILCIAGKIKKVIAKSWWNKPEEINEIAGDMFAAAYAFKKTAAILVYEKKNRTEWEYVSDHNGYNVYKPKEITIWANNQIDYETPEGKCIITE